MSKKPVNRFCKRSVAIKHDLRNTAFFFSFMLFIITPVSFAQEAESTASPIPIVSPSPFVSPSPIASPTPIVSPDPVASPAPSLEKRFLSNIVKDQYEIWTSPFHLRRRDARWLAPLVGVSAALIATDKRTASALDNNPNRLRLSRRISWFGSGYTVSGTAAAIYIIGRATHNRRARETGILAAEALINTAIVTQTMKFSFQRPRPFAKDAKGRFFDGGHSFPSGHSSEIWALAAVIDDEYGKRHKLVRFGIYGLATAVSISRYTGRNHFLSDALVGGAIGYGIGHFVYLRHHDTSLDSTPGRKKVTKLEKYFPLITPQYSARYRTYGANLLWKF